MKYYKMSEEDIEALLKPCPDCGKPLEYNRSPCVDLGCCGIEHIISCEDYNYDIISLKSECSYYRESFDEDELINKHISRSGREL